MTITPTPEQVAVAELNGWDPQEVAESSARVARVARVYEMMRKHTKQQLLRMVLNAGTQGMHHPSTWTKQELASAVEDQEHHRGNRAGRGA
jgi:hypothetical protein